MKNLYKIMSLFMLTAFLLNPVYAGNKDKQINEVFSKNLVKTLKSDNMSLKKSAKRLDIRYGDRLNVKDASFDIMGIYRYYNFWPLFVIKCFPR